MGSHQVWMDQATPEERTVAASLRVRPLKPPAHMGAGRLAQDYLEAELILQLRSSRPPASGAAPGY